MPYGDASRQSSFVDVSAVLTEALSRPEVTQLVLTGPHGMDHAAMLSQVGAQLQARGHEVTFLDCRLEQAAIRLAAEPPHHAILLHQGEFASTELLRLIAERILAADAPIIVGWDDSDFDADANDRIDALQGSSYELAEAFHRLQVVPLVQLPGPNIESLVYAHFSGHPDTLTVRATRQLAGGRPGWAIELARLASDGHVLSFPQPALNGLDSARWRTSSLFEIRRSLGELSTAESAAAIALSSLGQVAQVSAVQVFGSATVDTLLSRGLLVAVDEHRGLIEPERMLVESLRPQTPVTSIELAEDSLAAHLLMMAELGVGMNEAELRFCAARLAASAHTGNPDLTQISVETRGRILHRAAQLAGDFGHHNDARTLLMAAARLAVPGDPIELVRAIAGRDDPVSALQRLGRNDLAEIDPLAVNYLSGLFRAEAGVTIDNVTDEDSFLLSVWNRRDPLHGSLSRVQAIGANADADARLRLLADTLLLLASAISGLSPDPRVAARARLRFDELSQPEVSPTALVRDAKSTYLLTLAISDLLGTGQVRSAHLFEDTHRTLWPESHATWLSVLRTATLALAVGDSKRAGIEWELMLELIPRFSATRITEAFRKMLPLISARGLENPDPMLGSGYIALVVAHWAGDINTAAELLPREPSELSRATPLMRAIRESVGGSVTENPSRLIRAAEMLANLGQWSTALSALAQARSILIRRRSSGAIIACNAQITALQASARRTVPWHLDFKVTAEHDAAPRLTAREEEVASLAATGQSNREIASALGLSVRTVESHLAQARAKLGAPTRSDIAEYLRIAS